MKRFVSSELVIVITILGLGTVAQSILNPILPLYLTSIGVVPTVLGLMFSVAMVGMVIGEGSWGWVADKLGLKIPISVGTFACALVVFCFVLTQKVPAIFLIFLIWGIARSALPPVGRGYIGATAPLLKKATFMAIYSTILTASRSLGALMSGFVVDTWGYHRVFFISCGIACLGGIVMVTGLRKMRLIKPKPPVASPSLTDELPPPKQAYNYRPLALQCAIAALLFLGMGITITFLPLLATQVVGVAATEVGILFTIRGLVTMALLLPLGMLADRKGKRVLMILGLLVSASGMAGIAFTESYSWLIVFIIIHGLGMAMFSPAAVALLSDTVPLQRQATTMGIYGVCEDIGVIVGSAAGGFVWSAWGPQPTFLIGTVATGLGAVICLGLLREKASKNPYY